MNLRNALLSIVAVGTLMGVAAAHDMSAMGGADMNGMAQMSTHMMMSKHMYMTARREPSDADIARAKDVLERLRSGISRFKDARVALDRGYRPFLPTVPQEVYHFSNYRLSSAEYSGNFDPANPGSLLYVKKGPDNYKLVGAMYSAAPYLSEDDLDKLVPLSIAQWHAHTNICLPKGISLMDLTRGEIGAGNPHIAGLVDPDAVRGANSDEMNQKLGFMADGRFGFAGKISEPAECDSAGGHFLKQAFGWMVHVYPFTSDDVKVAFSQDVPSVP